MPDRPHGGDEPARPAPDPERFRPAASQPERTAELTRRVEPATTADAGQTASRRPETGRAEWWKPVGPERPRGPVTPWELAREQYRASENRPPRGSLADMKAQLEMQPPLDPSSPWNPDGSRRPKPPNPKDYELPFPSEAPPSAPGEGTESGTPAWLDHLPGGDRAVLPRPRQTERQTHPHAETGRPPPSDPAAPREVTPENPAEPEPLTDAEWKAHRTEVKNRLERARADGLATDVRYTVDPDREQWTGDRVQLHDSIVDDIYDGVSAVPNDHRAVMAGGLGGAGKSTVLARHADIDRSQYLTINPDDIKEHMARSGLIPEVEGLSPMEASDLVHEESSLIAKRLSARAMSDGKNIVWDITMASRRSALGRIDDLKDAGYTIAGVFVDIPVETSVARAEARHRHGHEEYRAGRDFGGRYVPSEVIRENGDAQWGSVNRRTFEEVKDHLDGGWSVFDNSVDGREPRLVAASTVQKRRETE